MSASPLHGQDQCLWNTYMLAMSNHLQWKKMNERLLPRAMENNLTSEQTMPLFAVNCNRIIDTAFALAAIPNELSFDPKGSANLWHCTDGIHMLQAVEVIGAPGLFFVLNAAWISGLRIVYFYHFPTGGCSGVRCLPRGVLATKWFRWRAYFF